MKLSKKEIQLKRNSASKKNSGSARNNLKTKTKE